MFKRSHAVQLAPAPAAAPASETRMRSPHWAEPRSPGACPGRGLQTPPRGASASWDAGAMAAAAGAEGRLRRAARVLAHVCGLTLAMKRYIEKSRAEEWARFYLSMKTWSTNELLYSRSSFSKYNLSQDFDKLKTLLSLQPKQRSQENLREIQLCLKKNRSFRSLPNELQLQLCQTAIYQEYEAERVVLRQGHEPLECCLVLAGHLKAMSSNTSKNKSSTSEILSEFEEGDFIGEICLLTNARRHTSVVCKTDVKLLVINKEDFCCFLAQRVQEQYQETCRFLRNLPLFSSWPKGKIDFLVDCSLRRYYRAGTTIVSDNLNSCFLVFVISGHCLVVAQMEYEKTVHAWQMKKTGSSALKNVHTGVLPRGPAGVTGVLEASTVSCKTSSAARKTTLSTKKPQLQVSSPATCFVEIRVLEQGGIFGLVETLDKSCDLQLCLTSGGAECIFIPRTVFLAEASTETRRTALASVCAYPSVEAVRKHVVEQQAWEAYKARLLEPYLKRGSKV
ncbi:cyclic nucleotide-binding domain-containing protein 2-like [Lepus europaeus]|uniref:cyclic nucleotide-binding domain-containing protein 2-like n=1 Tax=Lepus europaeus TaxID=9983 RepID=UPI002B4A0EF9|nr:cyclic nucleotide-binding domain-containing protein 2-like [Lepus europaeus]